MMGQADRSARVGLPVLAMVAIAVVASNLSDPGNAATGPAWRVYSDQSGSSVAAPATLKPVKAPSQLVLRSADGKTVVTLATTTEERPGFPGNDPRSDLTPTAADCDVLPPAYRLLNDQVSAYSCIKAGKVEYWVARYGGSGNVTLHAQYPVTQKADWDAVVDRMSASMKQQARHELVPYGCNPAKDSPCQ
jgi:hypothetical protein